MYSAHCAVECTCCTSQVPRPTCDLTCVALEVSLARGLIGRLAGSWREVMGSLNCRSCTRFWANAILVHSKWFATHDSRDFVVCTNCVSVIYMVFQVCISDTSVPSDGKKSVSSVHQLWQKCSVSNVHQWWHYFLFQICRSDTYFVFQTCSAMTLTPLVPSSEKLAKQNISHFYYVALRCHSTLVLKACSTATM